MHQWLPVRVLLSNFDISPLFASVSERTRTEERTAARGKLGLKISQSRNAPLLRDGAEGVGSYYSTHSAGCGFGRSLPNFRIVKVTFPTTPSVLF